MQLGKRWVTIGLAVVVAAAAAAATAQQGDTQPMSFFITSVGVGDGANLGGLEGADAHCQSLAAAAGRGDATWRAYLSTQGPNAVNARDRIGSGPWYAHGGRRRIAVDQAMLHGDTLELAPLLALRTHDDLVARFAGSPLMRAGRDRLVRNACTVAGNRRARELLPRLRRLTQDRDRGVAEHARWAVARISAAERP